MKISNSKFRLTKDPVIDFLPDDGKAFVKDMSLAENYGYFKDNKWIDQGVGFWKISAFGDTATKLDLCEKGTQILVTDGEVTMRTYKNKEGKEIMTPILNIREFFIL